MFIFGVDKDKKIGNVRLLVGIMEDFEGVGEN